MNTTRPDIRILLIEDSRADAKIIERALREGNIPTRLTVIPNGRQALDYLFGLRDEPNSTESEPDLILLDLNLPGLDGCQVLTQIKSDSYLRIIPVVVLTTSHRDEDVLHSYQAGANTYIPKPAEYALYRDLVATLRDYWIDTALKVPRPLHRRAGQEAGGV